jgi:hypothetical protein
MNAKIAVLTLALLPALAGARDLAPGTFELSGGTNLDYGKMTTSVPGEPDVDQTSLTLETDALYYVVKNLGLGLALRYDKSETDFGGLGGTVDSSSSLIGPALKFSLPVAPSASVLLGGAVGRMSMSSDGSDADGWAFTVGGGLRLFAADWASFDALVSYTNASIDFQGIDVDVTGWDVGLALSVFFGGR